MYVGRANQENPTFLFPYAFFLFDNYAEQGFFGTFSSSANMNLQLRFSWGHIIAFVGLIFLAYVVFMGETYSKFGDYRYAGIYTGICVVWLGVTIIGAQILKGASNKFYRSVILERVLLLLSLPGLAIAFVPYNHFWNVQGQDREIRDNFTKSIQGAHGIFSDYEIYATQRVEELGRHLKQSVSNPQLRQNRLDELTLVLLSDNFTSLRESADKWIDKASGSSSVWNVFLFGNIDNITLAIDEWSALLNNMSSKKIGAETYDVELFAVDSPSKESSVKGLVALKDTYVNDGGINLWAILTFVFLFTLMLPLPYYIQERNARNCEHFWDFGPFRRFYEEKKQGTITIGKDSTHNIPQKGAPV